MVNRANLRDDEHRTDEDIHGTPGFDEVPDMSNATQDGDRSASEGADEFPSLSPGEAMEVLESMGLEPLGFCDLHSKRHGLFTFGVVGCEDHRPFSSPAGQVRTSVCGNCQLWHYEGIGE